MNSPTGEGLGLAELDHYIEEARIGWHGVGVAIAVVYNEAVIYTRGYGPREAGTPAQIDSDTLFQIGSTTKAFTTAALGMLVEEGRLGWDDPVIHYLPEFKLQDPWLTRTLTVRDAITHRSGIADSYYPFLAIMSAEEAIHQLRFRPAEAPFRDSYRYSNLMYAVAGKILEATSGTSWSDFIRQRILRPLEMNRSGTSPYEFWEPRYIAPTFLGYAAAARISAHQSREPNLAMPHCWNGTDSWMPIPWQSYDNAAAAGALISSVAEMGNWLALQLSQGYFAGRRLLRPETLRELQAPQNLHGGGNSSPALEGPETYAMGWQRAQYRGHTHLAHGGGMVGSPAYVALLPERKAGVVVLSNGSLDASEKLGLHKAIAFWIFDRLLSAPPRNWCEEFLTRTRSMQQEARAKEATLQSSRTHHLALHLPLQGYVGQYRDFFGHSPPVDICLDDGQLNINFVGTGAFRAYLEPWHQGLFRIRPAVSVADVLGPQFIRFSLNANGEVASFGAFEATFQRLKPNHPPA